VPGSLKNVEQLGEFTLCFTWFLKHFMCFSAAQVKEDMEKGINAVISELE